MSYDKAGRTRTFGLTLPAILVSLLVAACSAGSGAAATQSGAGQTTAAAGATAAAGGATAAATTYGGDALPTAPPGNPDQHACAKVNKADAQALFTQDLGDLQIGGPVSSDQCQYNASNGDTLLEIETTDGIVNPNEYQEEIQSLGLDTPISGIGDAAMYELIAGAFPELMARKANATCLLSIGSDMTVLNVALASPAQFMSPIQPDAVAGFMQKFGNLCNEVFA